MTSRLRTREKSIEMSLAMPRARRSVAASPPATSNGMTAMDGTDESAERCAYHQLPPTTISAASTAAITGRARLKCRGSARRQPGADPSSRRGDPHRVGSHGTVDVLHLLVAGEVERQSELALQLVVGCAGNQDSPRLANLLQPRRHVDAVAEQIVALDHHVA